MSALNFRSRGSLAEGEGARDEHSSLTGVTSPNGAPNVDAAELSVKQKDPPSPTGSRFKAVGNVALAMRRFQGDGLPCSARLLAAAGVLGVNGPQLLAMLAVSAWQRCCAATWA